MLTTLGDVHHVALFAGRPSSLSDVAAPGLRIAINTAIIDADLIERIRPRILVLTDPVLHISPSARSGRFRSNLRRALARDGSCG
jgi:hypothetical protein